MRIELTVAIISGVIAIGSAGIAYKAQTDVAKLKTAHEKELELIRSKLAQALEERKFSFEERKNGYREFFDGTSKYWQYLNVKDRAVKANENGDESKSRNLESQAQQLYDDYVQLWHKARFKIGVFSDEAVVHAIAKYFRRPEFKKEKCNNAEKFMDDVAIYQAMRDEMEAQGDVRDNDLILVLFDCILEE